MVLPSTSGRAGRCRNCERQPDRARTRCLVYCPSPPSPALARMDKIFLHALTTEAIIGIYDWERRVKQTLVIDLELPCDVRKAAAADSI